VATSTNLALKNNARFSYGAIMIMKFGDVPDDLRALRKIDVAMKGAPACLRCPVSGHAPYLPNSTRMTQTGIHKYETTLRIYSASGAQMGVIVFPANTLSAKRMAAGSNVVNAVACVIPA
jgi:hypothetical protein